jgi:hypothetical protein
MPRQKLTDFDGPWLGQYILGGDDGHTPIPCYSLHEWGEWVEHANEKRIVAWTGNATKYVSTVFLSLDHRMWGKGPPILFESMAFVHTGRTQDFFGRGPEAVPDVLDQQRYSSWDDAETGHKAMVRKYLVNAKTRVGAADDDGLRE